MITAFNNVHVRGKVLCEVREDQTIKLEVEAQEIPICALVPASQWMEFKNSHPDTYQSIMISGNLQKLQFCPVLNSSQFVIKVGENSISCFHNIFQETCDEAEIQFHGYVKLKKKFDFDTASKLYMKRMIFETDEISATSKSPVLFEAMALRASSSYFNEIEEGEKMFLKASLVADRNGFPPYWKIKHRPLIDFPQMTKGACC